MNRQDEPQERSEQEVRKAELFITMSHELRSPLASIQGYTATLLRHDQRISREERRSFLLAIQTASDRLNDVINTLLKLSEFEAGTIALEARSINIVQLVREAVTGAEQHMEDVDMKAVRSVSSQTTRFTVQVLDRYGASSHEDVFIEVDQSLVRELLDRLLHNALLHAPTSGTITLTIRPLLSPEDLAHDPFSFQEATAKNVALVQSNVPQVVVLGVHDSGMGIAAHHLLRIFEPFYRVDTRLTRETNGLGLGLALAQRIVEMHSGSLWAESEPGKGTTFYVCLPQRRQNPREGEA